MGQTRLLGTPDKAGTMIGYLVILVAVIATWTLWFWMFRTRSGPTQTAEGVEFRGGIWLGKRKATWPLGLYRISPTSLEVGIRRVWMIRGEKATIDRHAVSSVSILNVPLNRGFKLLLSDESRVVLWPGSKPFESVWLELGWPEPTRRPR